MILTIQKKIKLTELSIIILLTGKPVMPEIVEIVCEVTRARVQWRYHLMAGIPSHLLSLP